MTLRHYTNKMNGDRYWFSLETGAIEGRPGQYHEPPEREYNGKHSALPCPMIIRDIPDYVSPLGTGVIGSRSTRRDDLKRGGCREVDPKEWHGEFRNERFAKKHNLKYTEVPDTRKRIAAELPTDD